MYLVELDSFTGLVKVDGEYDGVRAIKEFRDVINDDSLGVICFTAIALTVDYLTPIEYYREKDRPYKAMEIASQGDRRAFIWEQPLIQICLTKYAELQFNPAIEEKTALDFMLLNKLNEIKNEADEKIRIGLFGQLNTIKSLIENFNRTNESNDIYSDGPVRNGYKLTRLEEKALDKTSFYHKMK